jgi:hypothetical protein
VVAITFADGGRSGESQSTEREVRYGDVLLTIPSPDTGVIVAYNPPISSRQPNWIIQIYTKGDTRPGDGDELWPTMEIDSSSGAILSDTLSAALPDVAGDIVKSIQVVDRDTRQGWPYEQGSQATATTRVGQVEFISPDPLSGIRTGRRLVMCVPTDPGCAPEQLVFSNERSSMSIDVRTGEVVGSKIDPRDRSAFERIADSVKRY